MRIRKVTKSDFAEYYTLKQKETIEYSKIIKRKMELPSKIKLRKEFNGLLSNKDSVILVVESNKALVAYLHGSIIKSIWEDFGYLDDIFVSKKLRRKGIGTRLIKNFIKIIKSKKLRKIRVGANTENKRALRLYKKLGFKITHHELDKRLK